MDQPNDKVEVAPNNVIDMLDALHKLIQKTPPSPRLDFYEDKYFFICGMEYDKQNGLNQAG